MSNQLGLIKTGKSSLHPGLDSTFPSNHRARHRVNIWRSITLIVLKDLVPAVEIRKLFPGVSNLNLRSTSALDVNEMNGRGYVSRPFISGLS